MKKYFGIWFYFCAAAMMLFCWQPLAADSSIYSKEVVAEGGFYQLSVPNPNPVVMPNARILAMKGSDIFAFKTRRTRGQAGICVSLSQNSGRKQSITTIRQKRTGTNEFALTLLLKFCDKPVTTYG